MEDRYVDFGSMSESDQMDMGQPCSFGPSSIRVILLHTASLESLD
jgi:hypothetical protein